MASRVNGYRDEQLTVSPANAAGPEPQADALQIKSAKVRYSNDPDQPVFVEVVEAGGHHEAFKFANQKQLCAYLQGECETDSIAGAGKGRRKALLEQLPDVVRPAAQPKGLEWLQTVRAEAKRYELPTQKAMQRPDVPMTSFNVRQWRKTPIRPSSSLFPRLPDGDNSPTVTQRSLVGVATGGPLTDPAQVAEKARVLATSLTPSAAGMRSFCSGYFDSVTSRVATAMAIFPSLKTAQIDAKQVTQTLADTDLQLMAILKGSRPDEIFQNLKTQFADKPGLTGKDKALSDLQQLEVGAFLASVAAHYASGSGAPSGSGEAVSTEVLSALQDSLTTGAGISAHVARDVPVAVSQVLASLGIKAGTASVQGKVVTIFQTKAGTYCLCDGDQMYTGPALGKVLSKYEVVNGQVMFWHYISDTNGKIIGRVQTPLGAMMTSTASPVGAFQAFLARGPRPAGSHEEIVDESGRLVGDAEAFVDINDKMSVRAAGGYQKLLGADANYSSVGFDYQSQHFLVDGTIGNVNFAPVTHKNQLAVVGGIDVAAQQNFAVAGGNLTVGADARVMKSQNIGTDGGDVNSEARLAARYDHPLPAGTGSVFVSATTTGLPAGQIQDTATSSGMTAAQLKAFTFENREIQLASGVRLNLSQNDVVDLKAMLTTAGNQDVFGLGANYISGKTTLMVAANTFENTNGLSQAGKSLQVGVARDLGNGITLAFTYDKIPTGDASSATLHELDLQKVGRVSFGNSVPPDVAQIMERQGFSPDEVTMPKEGLMRGLQYRALLALQGVSGAPAGSALPPDVYSRLDLEFDPIGQTIVLPCWVKDQLPGRLDIAASQRVSLADFKKLDLGPVLSIDAKFNSWALEVLASLGGVEVTAKIGRKRRAVIGAEIGPAGFGGIVGYSKVEPDGRENTYSFSSRLQFRMERRSGIFGDFNSVRGFGPLGVTRMDWRNPGDMTVNPGTGEIFAYKRARTIAGYLDLFQYVTKPEEEKAQIRQVVAQLTRLNDQGVGVFFSPRALSEASKPKTLAQLTRYFVSPDFEKSVQALKAAGGDGIVFDSILAKDKNSYQAVEGDWHVHSIHGNNDAVFRPAPEGTPADVEREALVGAWQANGLRILGAEKLSNEEYHGLENLLAFMEKNIDTKQLVNKQLSFAGGSLFRSIGEFMGFVSLSRNVDAGATISVRPSLLRKFAKAYLRPCQLVWEKDLDPRQQKAVERLAAVMEKENLVINGSRQLVLLNTATFEQRTGEYPDPQDPFRELPLFVRKGDTVYVELGYLASDPADYTSELKRALGGELVNAISLMRAESTQEQRDMTFARRAGYGTLLQYYPERPAEHVGGANPGVLYSYRIFDAYGLPAKDAQGKPVLCSYAFFFPEGSEELRMIVRPDAGTPGEAKTVVMRTREDVEKVAKEYPQIGVIIDGMIDTKNHLPGLRLLERVRESRQLARASQAKPT